jgi:hypothetical protein
MPVVATCACTASYMGPFSRQPRRDAKMTADSQKATSAGFPPPRQGRSGSPLFIHALTCFRLSTIRTKLPRENHRKRRQHSLRFKLPAVRLATLLTPTKKQISSMRAYHACKQTRDTMIKGSKRATRFEWCIFGVASRESARARAPTRLRDARIGMAAAMAGTGSMQSTSGMQQVFVLETRQAVL